MSKATKKVAAAVGTTLAPKLVELAPGISSGVVQTALHRAIIGVGPLPGAAHAAEKQLEEQRGDRTKAVREVIENHVAYASVNGFATNIGGLITAAVTMPANVAGLALIECRMVAGIAHLRGYDLDDPRVRDAILVTLLGEDKVNRQVKRKKLPAPPMAIATAPVHDPDLDRVVAAEVTSELITRVAGKRVAGTVARKVPIVGGVVGATVDGWETFRVGRYASRELLPRARR
ncbi:EcsC family protein [Nocardioides sp. CER19]|uniref:EcsC family protein n=1 Tax=Nocardioides sp. CER19 TaxID=3038538 RepID=UPI0024492E57|nr:EcsC family protein [Nocardioides sp. CER19]MDH2412937.1 EcsC family protein [Nocardioides sp. CER19]